MSAAAPGRREQNRIERTERIRAAAAELFAEDGYQASTTQRVAERAGIPVATLFRYANTKGELLLMVHNEAFAAAIAAGTRDAAAAASPLDRCLALLGAVVRSGLATPEITSQYQRELMFGDPGERFRAEGLGLVAELAEQLTRAIAGGSPSPAAADAAAALFAALHLQLVQGVQQDRSAADMMTTLEAQATLLLLGVTTDREQPATTSRGPHGNRNEENHG